MYRPKEVGGKWYAVREIKVPLTNRYKTIFVRDFNGDVLELVDEEFATAWCKTKNEIKNLL
jgi:hypothetical protein